jgi:myo-inositol-1(or 4)-monophosphatase
VSGEFYTATADAGESCLGGVPIHVSSCTAIEHALVAFGFSANRVNIDRYYSEWKDVFDRCRKGLPLIVPSLTLCNVARGRLDAFIDFGCSMEGQAAAALILANAGGTILNYDLSSYDHRSKGAVACGPNLMAHLIEARKRENY